MAMDSNHLSGWAKFRAGILLIIGTVIPGLIIVAYWPDRQPYPRENVRPLYVNQPFHVRLACISDTACCTDSLLLHDRNVPVTKEPVYPYTQNHLIHLNIILLLLVAAGGFMGNMIHVATSFTTFVGAVEFKRSWLLWYFVKPFTAAALAMGLYFVFRAGFLNMSADSNNINIYGVVTIAVLTGLYTDRATLKLREVVNTIFGIKDGGGRSNPLQATDFKVTGISPQELARDVDQVVVISGEHLNVTGLKIQLGEQAIENAVITDASIAFHFRLPEAAAAGVDALKLLITDDKANTLYTGQIAVAKQV